MDALFNLVLYNSDFIMQAGPLAQLVEQETLNLLVVSSSLTGPTNFSI